MAYPKPLTEKTLKKMYLESGLSEEKISFLHTLFEAASNLYGVIPLEDLWDVYKEYSSNIETVKILKKDIFTFSSIVRREDHDYSVYEIDELYTEEKRCDKYRMLIINEVIRDSKIQVFYKLHEIQQQKPYYVPDDLLSIKGPLVTEYDEALKNYIDNIEANSSVIHDRYNEEKTKPSPYKGKRLSEFSLITDMDQFTIDWLSGKRENGPKKPQVKQLNEFMKTIEGTCAERFFRDLRFNIYTGWLDFSEVIKYFMKDLGEAGVELSIDAANKLVSLIAEFSNNSHLYVNRGWTPSDLSQLERSSGMPQTLSLGPGIMKAVEEGKISLDDLKAQAKAMGIKLQF